MQKPQIPSACISRWTCLTTRTLKTTTLPSGHFPMEQLSLGMSTSVSILCCLLEVKHHRFVDKREIGWMTLARDVRGPHSSNACNTWNGGKAKILRMFGANVQPRTMSKVVATQSLHHQHHHPHGCQDHREPSRSFQRKKGTQ